METDSLEVPQLLPELPVLERLEGTTARFDDEQRRNVANAMKNPAIATMADLVRSDTERFAHVRTFMGRKADFKSEYDRPGRTVAPWFASMARHETDLLDTALDAHFDMASQTVRERLEADSSDRGYSYWPAVVVGSGPQSQIFVSALTKDRPDLARSTLVVDEEETVGGTFRSDDAMNFRLNSRTRPQTDKPPVPGTRGNINTLVPGVMTLADSTTETYVQADSLGRTVRVNHALNNTDMGLGLELVKIVPDDTGYPSPMEGQVSVVLQDKKGNQYTVRTELLVASSGIGEPNLDKFDDETQALIRKQHEQFQDGEMPKVMLYSDLYAHMQREDFPLKGIKKVAVIAEGDSARTAIGTLLGYEPRDDDSVTQIDRIEELIWYGQRSNSDRSFVERTRLRYAQLGLEFNRAVSEGRQFRIVGNSQEVSRINLAEDGSGVSTADQFGNRLDRDEFDLVVVATGFKNESEKWLTEKFDQPLRVTDPKIQEALDVRSPQDTLEAGTVITFPLGFNIDRIQILSVKVNADGDYSYMVSIQTNEGEVSVGELLAKRTQASMAEGQLSLKDYCDIDNFSDLVPGDIEAEAVGANEQAVVTGPEFLRLTPEDRLKFLRDSLPVVVSSNKVNGLNIQRLYKVVEVDGSYVYLDEFVFNSETKVVGSGRQQIELSVYNFDTVSENTAFIDGGLLYEALSSEGFAQAVQDYEREVVSRSDALQRIDDLTDQGASLVFRNQEGQMFNFVSLYRNNIGEVKFVYQNKNGSWAGASIYGLDELTEQINQSGSVEIFVPKRSAEVIGRPAEVEGISGEEFSRLTLKEKCERIKAGTVYMESAAKDEVYVALDSPNENGEFRYSRASIDRSSGLLEVSGLELGVLNVNDLANTLADVILTNPALFKENIGQSVVLDLSTDEIIDRLDEFYAAGAVIVSRGSLDVRLPLITPLKDAKDPNDSQVDTAFVSNQIASGADRDELISSDLIRQNRNRFKENGWNRVIIPKFAPVQPGQKSRLLSSSQFLNREPDLTIIDVPGDDGEPVAKRVISQPVLLVGPAANIPVDPKAIRLIPDIPDNTVSLFSSQPRVTRVAGSLALSFPMRSQRYSSTALGAQGLDIGGQKPDNIAFTVLPSFEPKLPAAAKRMPLGDLLRFGLGTKARQLGLNISGEELKEIRLKVERVFGGEEISISSVASKKDSVVQLDSLTIQELVTMPHTIHALRRLLADKDVKSLSLVLPVDSRGLQASNIEINPVRPKSSRTPKQTVPKTANQ